MKFTKQFNLRIKRGWIEHAVDVAGVKRACEEDEGASCWLAESARSESHAPPPPQAWLWTAC